jgi:hypothetical protein
MHNIYKAEINETTSDGLTVKGWQETCSNCSWSKTEKHYYNANEDEVKKELIENSAAVFEAPKVDDAAIEKEKDRYLRVIGDLQMQLDFAKRVSRKLGIEIPAED